MNKKEYAEMIAKELGGKVVEIEKANAVVCVGIEISTDDDRIKAIHYVDDFFGRLSVDDAISILRKNINESSKQNLPSIESIICDVKDFATVKQFLRVRLYNVQSNFEICVSAQKYGFNDLIVVPYIEYSNAMAVRIYESMLEKWEVTKEQVIDIAMENTKKDCTIKTMTDVLKEFGRVVDTDEVCVVSNSRYYFGASSILFVEDQLHKIFPNGYTVIPSSVHEVLVIDKDIKNETVLNTIIQDINTAELLDTDVLSNHIYEF